jgi:hypothetical protein
MKIIDNLKTKWLQIAKFGIFISGVITILLSPPPAENFNTNTVRFLITIIISFLLIPLFLYKKKIYFKAWLFSSIVAFIISLSLLISYNYLFSKYVVNYFGDQIVIGNKFIPTELIKIKSRDKEDNTNYEDGSAEHNKQLLFFKGGNAESIWKGVNRNKTVLITIFYLSISTITILLICLIQTIQILYSEQE